MLVFVGVYVRMPNVYNIIVVLTRCSTKGSVDSAYSNDYGSFKLRDHFIDERSVVILPLCSLIQYWLAYPHFPQASDTPAISTTPTALLP